MTMRYVQMTSLIEAPPPYAKQAVSSTEARRCVSSSDSYSFKGAFKALASVVGAVDILWSSSILPQSQSSDCPASRRTQTLSRLAVNDPARWVQGPVKNSNNNNSGGGRQNPCPTTTTSSSSSCSCWWWWWLWEPGYSASQVAAEKEEEEEEEERSNFHYFTGCIRLHTFLLRSLGNVHY